MKKNNLEVKIFDTRLRLGREAAAALAERINSLLEKQAFVNIIFAAAPSQNEFLMTLRKTPVDWSRIRAFHMDEYIGLSADAPQSFGNFLREIIFDRLSFCEVYYINGQAPDKESECKRYAALLKQYPTDIVCMGIGENGHIAFNDPPVANFNDPAWVKVVTLDADCRQQQVNDRCFLSLNLVPECAFTLTIPALMSAPYIYCMVPGETKANAVFNTLNGAVRTECPASILRNHLNAVLFLDKLSSSKLKSNLLMAMLLLLFFSITGCGGLQNRPSKIVNPVQLITLDPGHFHAALVQKSDYPEVDSVVHVYAPAGKELQAHLALIEKYNTRVENPTHWKEEVVTGSDYLAQLFKARAGNVVVIAGNNQKKTSYIRQAIDSGFNVLADKPMVINAADFAMLEQAFLTAGKNKKLLYDIMTERYQITNILQKELAQLPEVFGALQRGTLDSPAVVRESVHHFYKEVSGKPLQRPAWYFDVTQEGDGIVDVATHLVDLVQWDCFPGQALDYKKDIHMLSAGRWPTDLQPAEFKKVTGLDTYPAFLLPYTKDSILQVYANGEMNYTLRSIHVQVIVKWNFQAPPGCGDTDFSLMRGSLSNLVVRQNKEQQFKPVLSIEPLHSSAGFDTVVLAAINKLGAKYPGLEARKTNIGWELVIPQKYKLDHEGTFAEVMKKYLGYLKNNNLPAWEVPGMLAKYYTTIMALEMAQTSAKGPGAKLKKYTH